MDPMRALRYARRYANWREILAARGERGARGNPAWVRLRSGERFEAPEDVNAARIVNGVYFRKVYTPRGFGIGSDDAVVDVGANIGVFSVYAASRTRGPVLAIEPFPANFDFLERNLAHNDCERVLRMARAASDQEGTAKLYLGRKGVTHQLFDHDERGALEHCVEVPTATLEQMLDEAGIARVDLLKLDCEGAEGLILRAASPSLLARIRRIALEFHDFASPLSHTELEALLSAAGFATRLEWDGRASTGFLYARR
jgi:FkbM family methyltransferase